MTLPDGTIKRGMFENNTFIEEITEEDENLESSLFYENEEPSQTPNRNYQMDDISPTTRNMQMNQLSPTSIHDSQMNKASPISMKGSQINQVSQTSTGNTQTQTMNPNKRSYVKDTLRPNQSRNSAMNQASQTPRRDSESGSEGPNPTRRSRLSKRNLIPHMDSRLNNRSSVPNRNSQIKDRSSKKKKKKNKKHAPLPSIDSNILFGDQSGKHYKSTKKTKMTRNLSETGLRRNSRFSKLSDKLKVIGSESKLKKGKNTVSLPKIKHKHNEAKVAARLQHQIAADQLAHRLQESTDAARGQAEERKKLETYFKSLDKAVQILRDKRKSDLSNRHWIPSGAVQSYVYRPSSKYG
jgi:hypothetical protein